MKIYGDDYFMKLALQEAQKAAGTGEVPVGAVITAGDQLLARCHNSTEQVSHGMYIVCDAGAMRHVCRCLAMGPDR